MSSFIDWAFEKRSTEADAEADFCFELCGYDGCMWTETGKGHPCDKFLKAFPYEKKKVVKHKVRKSNVHKKRKVK